ncbi:MAG: PLP-dependent aminotransferase family protein [bacterium]|jgi:2-aminoadipate transaminase
MNQNLFARRLASMSGSVIREILKLTQQPDMISFAGGLPSPDSFPREELTEIVTEIIAQKGSSVLQYGTTEGYQPLREFIADWVKERGIEADPSEVLIISGSQQGLDLMGKAFIDPGDNVLVEDPTYLAALQIFTAYEANFTSIPTDNLGPIPAKIKEVAQGNKINKLIYLIPTFQNPTGITMPVERRQEVVSVAEELGLVLMEDDPYGELRYSGEPVPALKSFDTKGSVVYLGSFSKIISPGLRVGYIIGNQEIIRKLTIGKQTVDLHTSNLSQAIVYEYCSRGLLPKHLAKIRAQYKEKRDLMLKLLEENFPPEVTWTKPEGGLFLWMELPQGISTTELLKEAIKEKVAFIPGDSFFPHGGGSNTIRLNFSNATKNDLEQGITRMAKVTKQFLSRQK